MNRRNFITKSLAASSALVLTEGLSPQSFASHTSHDVSQKPHPLPITMWDFSWIERRWPGAGYEDWDLVLDELRERGYEAVRIDAFPHLLSNNPQKQWLLKPQWSQQDWGSPWLNTVVLFPALTDFIGKCKDRDIKVGLSTWYREDTDNVRMGIASPQIMADQWITTLKLIEKEGLLDAILYVDLCNEWPGAAWCPFFTNEPPELTWGAWYTERSLTWMREAISLVRQSFPELPLSFSFDLNKPDKALETDLKAFDYLDPHIWMVQANAGEFYKLTGYNYDLFLPDSYHALVANGLKTYNERPQYWQELLVKQINEVAEVAKQKQTALITTECWGIVDYKDWPMLEWGWVKELCALGTRTAAATGQWLSIATSNFCGPQFRGMWRDVDWHRELTGVIRNAPVNKENFKNSDRFLKRIS